MRNLDAMLVSRWIVAGLVLLAPVIAGCNSKTDTQPQAQAPTAAQQQPPTFNSADPSVPEPMQAQELPGDQVPAERLTDEELVREAFGSKAGEADITDVDPASEAERPKSIFRSIGRALQKGVTDAAGVTAAENEGKAP